MGNFCLKKCTNKNECIYKQLTWCETSWKLPHVCLGSDLTDFRTVGQERVGLPELHHTSAVLDRKPATLWLFSLFCMEEKIWQNGGGKNRKEIMNWLINKKNRNIIQQIMYIFILAFSFINLFLSLRIPVCILFVI